MLDQMGRSEASYIGSVCACFSLFLLPVFPHRRDGYRAYVLRYLCSIQQVDMSSDVALCLHVGMTLFV